MNLGFNFHQETCVQSKSKFKLVTLFLWIIDQKFKFQSSEWKRTTRYPYTLEEGNCMFKWKKCFYSLLIKGGKWYIRSWASFSFAIIKICKAHENLLEVKAEGPEFSKRLCNFYLDTLGQFQKIKTPSQIKIV